MIKDAIQYIVGLGKTELFDIGDFKYSNDNLRVVEDPEVQPLQINTLDGIIDYVKNDIDSDSKTLPVIINILSPTKVRVISELFGAQQREIYLEAIPCNPSIVYDRFMDIENFNIQLLSGFVSNEEINTILRVTVNITESQVMSFSDDGISQSVTAKSGIARVEEVIVPNPVTLRPFRTFPEIEQPESPFVLRMADGPRAALFCADGGAWKLQAIQFIKGYLETGLKEAVLKKSVIIIA